MNDVAKQAPAVNPMEAEIEEILAEAGGNARLAIRHLLHDLSKLAEDGLVSISRGYVRGWRVPVRPQARR